MGSSDQTVNMISSLPLLLSLSLSSGLPAPQTGDDFVIVSAGEPREGRLLISDTPLDRTPSDVASFRLPVASPDSFDDVVVLEAGDYDEPSGRSSADIPRDETFGLRAGPRLPLPDHDVLVLEVGDDGVVELSQHHGAVGVFVVQLEELEVVGVASLGVGGGDDGLNLLDDIVVLGELLALLVSLTLGDTGLLGDVQAESVHDVSEEEQVDLAFAIPVVDVADVLNLSLVNHFEKLVLPLLTLE